jgi:hypothetical protein
MVSSEKELFERAMRLPPGNYIHAKDVPLQKGQGILYPMYAQAITNAASEHPVIGTTGLEPCLNVFAVTADKEIAVMGLHLTPEDMNPRELQRLVDTVRRGNTNIPVELHFIGVALDGPNDSSREGTERTLGRLLKKVEELPHVSVKTFDVLDKPHPIGVAFDARSRKLIALSRLVTYMGNAYLSPDEELYKDVDESRWKVMIMPPWPSEPHSEWGENPPDWNPDIAAAELRGIEVTDLLAGGYRTIFDGRAKAQGIAQGARAEPAGKQEVPWALRPSVHDRSGRVKE